MNNDILETIEKSPFDCIDINYTPNIKKWWVRIFYCNLKGTPAVADTLTEAYSTAVMNWWFEYPIKMENKK